MPAFVGLGAPYWNPRVRGALFGLTRNTGPAELAHAALESVCYQTFDLWAAMRADWPDAKAANIVLRVDGGMTASDWTMQRLADLLDAPVDRPMIQETTALGAAYLAGLAAGVYPEPQNSPTTGGSQRRANGSDASAATGYTEARVSEGGEGSAWRAGPCSGEPICFDAPLASPDDPGIHRSRQRPYLARNVNAGRQSGAMTRSSPKKGASRNIASSPAMSQCHAANETGRLGESGEGRVGER